MNIMLEPSGNPSGNPRRVVGSSVTMKCPTCGFTRSLNSLRKDLNVITPSVAVEMWVRTVQKGVKGLAWEKLTPRSMDAGAQEILLRVRASITMVMLTWLERFACLLDGTPLVVTAQRPDQLSGKLTPTMLECAPSHLDQLPPVQTELTTPTMLETSTHVA